jgi:hypothetical protein
VLISLKWAEARRKGMARGLVEFVLRYGSRVRLAWRTLLGHSDDIAEQFIKPDSRFARKSQATGDHYARDSIAPVNGMVNDPERNVHDVLVAAGRHNPVNEGELTIERVNDFGALLNKRQIFFR